MTKPRSEYPGSVTASEYAASADRIAREVFWLKADKPLSFSGDSNFQLAVSVSYENGDDPRVAAFAGLCAFVESQTQLMQDWARGHFSAEFLIAVNHPAFANKVLDDDVSFSAFTRRALRLRGLGREISSRAPWAEPLFNVSFVQRLGPTAEAAPAKESAPKHH